MIHVKYNKSTFWSCCSRKRQRWTTVQNDTTCYLGHVSFQMRPRERNMRRKSSCPCRRTGKSDRTHTTHEVLKCYWSEKVLSGFDTAFAAAGSSTAGTAELWGMLEVRACAMLSHPPARVFQNLLYPAHKITFIPISKVLFSSVWKGRTNLRIIYFLVPVFVTCIAGHTVTNHFPILQSIPCDSLLCSHRENNTLWGNSFACASLPQTRAPSKNSL